MIQCMRVAAAGEENGVSVCVHACMSVGIVCVIFVHVHVHTWMLLHFFTCLLLTQDKWFGLCRGVLH